jgi:hypothetical protein
MTASITGPAGSGVYGGIPAFGGDFAEAVAELSVRSGKEDRAIEREIEHTEEDAASHAAADEASALRKKAGDLEMQGIVDGCATIGAGLCQGVGAASGSAQGWSQASATGLQGGAKLGDGVLAADEANAEAREKLSEQAAERANSSARAAHDAASTDQSTIDKTLTAYAQIEETRASASLAILRRA